MNEPFPMRFALRILPLAPSSSLSPKAVLDYLCLVCNWHFLDSISCPRPHRSWKILSPSHDPSFHLHTPLPIPIILATSAPTSTPHPVRLTPPRQLAMSFHDFNPGQTIAGCMDPSRLQHDILQIAKETLDLQLNSFQSVVAVSQKDYLGLGQDGQAFMAFYMGLVYLQPQFLQSTCQTHLTIRRRRIFRKPVMWAKDGMDGNADRWVLGPCEKFVSGPHMIVSVNGIAIVVQRPPSHFLEDASGSEAGAHCTESPEPVCKIKVPRPPNAFILYRKDRHATMKQENSHLSNNDICEYFDLVPLGNRR